MAYNNPMLSEVPRDARSFAVVHRADLSASEGLLAANPFEPTLRAIALEVPGLSVRPQVTLPGLGRPDLVDDRLRLILEADSFTWHGHRAALASDCRRYNRFVIEGWTVLRFGYEDVMGRAEEVRRVLIAAVSLTEVLNQRGSLPGVAA